MVSVEAGNDLGVDPSTRLFQVVRNWLGRDGNEIRLPPYPCMNQRCIPSKCSLTQEFLIAETTD
jgi:hypothetical protein